MQDHYQVGFVKSRKVRLRKKRGRGWLYQVIEIPTDEEMDRIAAELHAKHESVLLTIMEWKVLYRPGADFNFVTEKMDPFDGTKGEKKEISTKQISYCEFGYDSNDWKVSYTWKDEDDQFPSRQQEKGDIVPLQAEIEELDTANCPSNLQNEHEYMEGTMSRTIVNSYERDPEARKACLQLNGYSCAVCNMDFQEVYGKIGKHFIHVHHKEPLAGRKTDHTVNPASDLVPVCPNCHAMLHTSNPPLGIDKLKQIMGRSS